MPFGLSRSDEEPDDEARQEALPEGDDEPAVDIDSGGEGGSGAEPDIDSPRDGGPLRTPDFRPSYLEERAPAEVTPGNAFDRPPPAGDVFFVTVTKPGGQEVHRFEDPVQAQRFVEERLQQGLPQDEVAAFSGRRLALEVSHRPVVTLLGARDE